MVDRILLSLCIGAITWRLAQVFLHLIRQSVADVAAIRAVSAARVSSVNDDMSFSAMVIAKDHEATLQNTIDSIVMNGRKLTEIIIVDNASRDDSRKVARSCKKAHVAIPIKVVVYKKHRSFLQAAADAARAHASGSHVIAVPANVSMASDALDYVAGALVVDTAKPDIPAVCYLRHVVRLTPSLLGFWQHIESIVVPYYQINTNTSQNYGFDDTFACRRRWLLDYPFGSPIRILSADKAVAYCAPKPARPYLAVLGSATWRTLLMAVIDLLAIVYSFYVAIAYEDPLLLTVTALILASWMAFKIVSMQHLDSPQKAQLLFFIPAACGLYVMQALIKLALFVARPAWLRVPSFIHPKTS